MLFPLLLVTPSAVSADPHDSGGHRAIGQCGQTVCMRVLLGPPGASTAGADEPGVVRMRYSRGQLQAEPAQHPEYDPQKLFTQAALQGLWAKLCDDADALDDYLPPHIAEMARKVAEALEVPVRSAVFVTASHLAICRLMTAARSGVEVVLRTSPTSLNSPGFASGRR
ncbi:hypothetical protein [Streptomyces coeruleorubidus]|uniref:hypothetical protein n=1 Tax=Streptomyces coeruleorubidus TaxID=116188 RepID=UPI0033A2322F